MPLWHRLAVVGVVLLVAAVVARLLDARIARRQLDPAQRTRYRVLRRSVATTVLLVGVLSALLVIPQVRAVAGGLLASSAVIGIVVGFASPRPVGTFVAGLLMAVPDEGEVLVTAIDSSATVTLRAWTSDLTSAERVASDLRLRAFERLRAAGVYA